MVKRRFILGDEWVYLKIYSGEIFLDWLLVNVLYPLMKQLLSGGSIDKWFFIRYNDEHGFHLRVRCHLCGLTLMTVVCSLNDKLHKFVDKQLIHSICYDTYNRELERYGDRCYENTETIFHISSNTICSILKRVSMEEDKDSFKRIECALMATIGYIQVLHFDFEGQLRFLRENRDAFLREFNLYENNGNVFLDKYYRKHKKSVEDLLSGRNIIPYEKVLKTQERLLGQEFLKIKSKLNVDAELYIASLIHMAINRIFVSSNREFELVVYYFLYKYYMGCYNRTKYNK